MAEMVEIGEGDYFVLHPRPVYLIVSLSEDSTPNVMAASWVTPVNDEPFLVGIALGKESKTLSNILRTGECTINVVGEELVDKVYAAGSYSGWKTKKWEMLGFTPHPSTKIKTPGIAEAYGFIECSLVKTVDFDTVEFVVCKSVSVHVKKDLVERNSWNLQKAKILMHLKGRAFTTPRGVLFATRRA